MSKENPEFWCIEGAEACTTNDISEVLQDFVDGLDCDDEIPESIKLEGYDKTVIHEQDKKVYALNCLEYLTESLDDDYRHFDHCDNTEITESMKSAALKFVDEILNEFDVASLDKVAEKEVRILDYLDKSDIES